MPWRLISRLTGLLRRSTQSCIPQDLLVFPRAIYVSEQIGAYGAGGLHPVHLNDLLLDRFRILRKLGQGMYATVWLASDLRTRRLVALKIGLADYYQDSKREATLHLRVGGYHEDTPVAKMHEAFDLQGPNGKHHILVLELIGRTLGEWISCYERATSRQKISLNTATVRSLAKKMVASIAHIHQEGIVHCDVSVSNFMFRYQHTDRGSMVENFQESVCKHERDYVVPSSTKDHVDLGPEYPKYLVEPQPLGNDPRQMTAQHLVLADFGSSVVEEHCNDNGYTYPVDAIAPELVLGLPLSPAADIWALGCAIFHVVTLRSLFEVDGFMSQDVQADEYLACVTEVMGRMPVNFLERWERRHKYVTDEGEIAKNSGEGPFGSPLREEIDIDRPYDMTNDDASQFEDLMRQMCRWEPDRRPTAAQLLKHSWFKQT